MMSAFKKYMPNLDLSKIEWDVLPIDRIEGKSKTDNWMPDTPTIHQVNNIMYCWPTKLTFAPMLADMVMDRIDFEASDAQTDYSDLQDVEYAQPPWDIVEWKK